MDNSEAKATTKCEESFDARAFPWLSFHLHHQDNEKCSDIQNALHIRNKYDEQESMDLEVSNPHVPLSIHDHGIRLIPNFCSDDEIQSVLQDLERERASWEGFQQRRRVYRYNLNADNNTKSELPPSLRGIVDRFEQQFTNATQRYRPHHLVIEDYPSANSVRINASQKIVTTFESPRMCPVCCALKPDGQEDDKQTNNSTTCTCFVAQITLLPEAAVEHWNQPLRRDPQCYNLKSPQHWTDVRLPRGSLLLKTQESLWQWRTSLVPSGIPPSNAQHGPTDQPLQRIVLLKLYRLPEQGVTDIAVSEGDDDTRNNDGNRNSQHPEQVFGYIPGPQDVIPPPDAVMPDMKEILTIIITTSPIRSHPSTELLERTMSTFALAGPEFLDCQKLIVCDGVRVRDEDESANITKRHNNVKQCLRNGIVTPTQQENYHQFKENLKHLCEVADGDSPFRNTQVVELDSRHGYGFALRHALKYCVKTRFVCIIQHDRTFMRPTPMHEALHCMWRHPNVKYIGMSMRSNLLYRDIFQGKYGPDAAAELGKLVLRPPELLVDGNLYGPDSQSFRHLMDADDFTDQVRGSNQTLLDTYHANAERWAKVDASFARGREKNELSTPAVEEQKHQMILMPTLYWYDNTHLAETAHYRDFIYEPRYKMVARGGFVEDKLSPVLVRTVERLGLADGHSRFGCFLLDDCSGLFFTGHLDGGSYLTDEQRQAMQSQNHLQREAKG